MPASPEAVPGPHVAGLGHGHDDEVTAETVAPARGSAAPAVRDALHSRAVTAASGLPSAGAERGAKRIVVIAHPELCLACGDCADACPHDAIRIAETAVVVERYCRGCGQCIPVCPRGVIQREGEAAAHGPGLRVRRARDAGRDGGS